MKFKVTWEQEVEAIDEIEAVDKATEILVNRVQSRANGFTLTVNGRRFDVDDSEAWDTIPFWAVIEDEAIQALHDATEARLINGVVQVPRVLATIYKGGDEPPFDNDNRITQIQLSVPRHHVESRGVRWITKGGDAL